MDEIPQLIELAEQGDTEAARKILEIYHESLYSDTKSQTVLIGAHGASVDVRILAYLARCFRPIIEDGASCRADANRALNLSTPRRGAKTRIKPNRIKVVCLEIFNEQRRIKADRLHNKSLQGELSPLEQAIDIVGEKHRLSPSTLYKDYWKSDFNNFKG